MVCAQKNVGPLRFKKNRLHHQVSPYSSQRNRRGSFIGRIFSDRYEILDIIGKGTTAQVLRAYDLRTRSYVVIKVQKYEDYSYVMREVDILDSISKAYEHRDVPIIKLLDWFIEKDAGICLVFEEGMHSLWDHMKKDKSLFCLRDVQEFGRQILTAVSKFHQLGITHADFKPENLVFFPAKGSQVRDVDCEDRCVSPSSFDWEDESTPHLSDAKALKVIDFGLAVFEEDHHTPVVGTRAYSPPEILLETGWSQPIDIWGVACILMELYTGQTIFRSSEDLEQLALWEQTLGPMPEYLYDRASEEKREWFTPKGLQQWPFGMRHIQHQPRLIDMFHPHDKLFFDLISGMLQYDPKRRMTAEECLDHPFFTTHQDCTCRS